MDHHIEQPLDRSRRPTDKVRVAVHAPDPITAAGVLAYLRTRPELTILLARDIADCDIVIVATDTVTADVMTTLRRTAASTKTARTVLVTNHLAEADLLTAIECRVVAVLPRNGATSERLLTTILAANRGRGELPPDLLGALLTQVERLQRDVLAMHGLSASGLAPREIDILRLMAEGADTVEIAKNLCYSERTVKNIIYGLMHRLNLRNRPHAVAYAMRAGII